MRLRRSPLSSTKSETDSKSEFFLTASHQLKAPVAVIQWCLQSLLESKTLDRKDRSVIQKALSQADAMSAFIKDMLHIFRLGATDLTHTLEPVQLNEVIQESIQQCEMAAQQRKVHLIAGPLETLPVIYAHTGYIKQAVINLIDNAIKYSKEGGKVEITASTHAHMVEIKVMDNGIGIPEAEQSRIFTEFFRGEEAKAARADGTGLGLVLVKHIVETFGGQIHFTSKLHQGTTFTIRLPFQG